MPSSPPLLAGNWKMNGLRSSLAEVTALRDVVKSGRLKALDVLLCPPFTLLSAAADLCAGSGLAIGGQDCSAQPSGAATGDISAEMLKDAGARTVILGHSERRGSHGETSEQVRAKAEAAGRASLSAIVCVGETRAERDRGETLRVIGRQIDESVPESGWAEGLALAYEPVWAIGTGILPSADAIAEVHGFMRRRLEALLGRNGSGVRLLYGGSVKPDNAGDIWSIEHVDGLLVGGCSLSSSEFMAIGEAR